MGIGKAFETVETIDAPIEAQLFRCPVQEIDPPALVNSKFHDVAFDIFVENLGEKFRCVFAFQSSVGR